MASEEHCVKALDRHEGKLSANPRVQGLGIVAQEGKPFDSADCAVAIYVEKMVPSEDLPEEHQLPERLEIEHDGDLHEVPVRVIEQGPVTLEAPGIGIESIGVGLEEPGPVGLETEPGLEPAEDSEE